MNERDSVEVRRLYVDLLKKSLTMWLWQGRDGSLRAQAESRLVTPWNRFKYEVKSLLFGRETKPAPLDPESQRREGSDWPALAYTMIGLERMQNIQACVESALAEGVEGDLIETGVWRGGATIFMRGILKAHGVTDRMVWVADSFEGLPPPDPDKYPADRGDIHHRYQELAVSLETVQASFQRFGLLDEQVKFLKGWFKDTLPSAPIKQLAVARLDGDMYESTFDALNYLYPKLSPGGFLIVDDYSDVPGCKQAVEDYRRRHSITEPVQLIDRSAVYWRRRL